jgi:hypothetical protein
VGVIRKPSNRQAHADVARRGVHIAALEQARPTRQISSRAIASVMWSTVKALVKKSSVPKLPDLRVVM